MGDCEANQLVGLQAQVGSIAQGLYQGRLGGLIEHVRGMLGKQVEVAVLITEADDVVMPGDQGSQGLLGAERGGSSSVEALLRKPGALPGATALEQARAAGKFTPERRRRRTRTTVGNYMSSSIMSTTL